MPLDFKVIAKGPDFIPSDITSDVERAEILWLTNQGLPTLTLDVNNVSGKYTRSPLFSSLLVTLPNGVGSFTFKSETNKYVGEKIKGHILQFQTRAAPELLNMTEGNLDVVGTDLPVGRWNNRSSLYIPYVSKYVSTLNSNLLDIGDLLTAMLHTAQPNQTAGYRGRLGYDATGLGLKTSDGIDYADGSQAAYIKGMFSVGQGSTGSQKTGLDVIRDILTKNIIDTTGTPLFYDFYVDMTQAPNPLLKVFQRGSVNSNQAFTAGTDPIEVTDLPVDAQDVKDFIILWENAESLYPGGGDAWSNYPNGALPQWVDALDVIGTGALAADSSVNRYGFGSSNRFTNNSLVVNWQSKEQFNLLTHGYADLNANTRNRNIKSFNFSFQRGLVLAGDEVRVTLYDDTLANIIQTNVGTFPLPTAGVWKDFSVAYPASGTGNQGAWTVQAGTWDYAATSIGQIEFLMLLGNGGGSAQQFWFDYIQFKDAWQFSPVYSYALNMPASTTTTGALTAGVTTVVPVYSTAGFVVGQYIVIDTLIPASLEVGQIASIQTSAQTITLAVAVVNSHGSGITVNGATHNPLSITAYGLRIMPFVDFYANNAGSDSAMAITTELLQSRMAKKSTGTFTVSGYAAQVPNIKPGSIFSITDPKDIYIGDATIDSVITGWIADQVKYTISKQQGFIASYTLEPYYNVIVAGSPDNNLKNLYRVHGPRSSAELIGRLFRQTQVYGVQK